MKNSIPPNMSGKEQTLQPLIQALASGFTDAGRKSLSSTATATFTGVGTTAFSALAASAPLMTGLDVRFDAGIRGGAMLLLENADLVRIGGLLSGMEFRADEILGEEIIEAILLFFASALDSTGKSLGKSHGLSAQAAVPQLVNPDGKSSSLLPLADSFMGAVSLNYQISMEGHPDSRFCILVQTDLEDSLELQLLNGGADTPAETAGPPLKDLQTQAAQRENAEPLIETQAPKWNMDLILDVELEVVVSFGETEMPLRDVLKLGVGSIIELEKGVNDPVAILVNHKPIARGEVVMVDGNYGVKVLEAESTADRIRSMG